MSKLLSNAYFGKPFFLPNLVFSLMQLFLRPIILLLMCIGFSAQVHAQTENIDDELTRAKKQLELAKLKADIAEQQKKEADNLQALGGLSGSAELKTKSDLADYQKKQAELQGSQATAIKAYTPDFAKVTPPSGSMTVTGQFAETEKLVYKSLAAPVKSISAELEKQKTTLGTRFLLADNATVNQILLYGYIKSKMESASSAMTTADTEANKLINDIRNPQPGVVYQLSGAGALLAAGTALQSVANAVQLFKSDKQVTNTSLEIPKHRIISMLKESYPSAEIYCPELMPVGLSVVNDPILDASKDMANFAVQMGGTIRELDALAEEQTAKVTRLQRTLNSKGISNALRTSTTNALNTTRKNLRNIQTQKDALTYWIGSQKEIDKVLGASAGLTGDSFLFSLVKAGRVAELLNDSPPYKLMMVSAECRGSEVITKSVWTNARLKHSASSAFTCIVFDSSGKIVFSQTASGYEPYTKSSNIK